LVVDPSKYIPQPLPSSTVDLVSPRHGYDPHHHPKKLLSFENLIKFYKVFFGELENFD
jgi:hypothetical protein